MESKNKNSLILVLLTSFILIAVFAAVLFFLNKKGYLSFNKNADTTCYTGTKNQDTNDSDGINSITKASTNMTNDEVYELWNKIKGNWANIKFNDDTCAGSSLEINTYVKVSKFNSDGIITYRILSFNKVSDGIYELNLVNPVNLNNQLDGGIVASYITITIDLGEPGDNKISVKRGETFDEFEYVGDNKTIINENTYYQYVDGGFSQNYYCDWYKKNH